MFPEFEELRFKNYKSFKDFSSISTLKNINVFIGRNNCGKSSCIDIIEALTKSKIVNNDAKIRLKIMLSKDDVDKLFNLKDEKQDEVEEKLKRYENKCLEFNLSGYGGKLEFNYDKTDENGLDYDYVQNVMRPKFENLRCRRLDAERDIVPEQEIEDVSLSENGAGATNLVRHVLLFKKCEERLVREDLLNALNEIIYPDSEFDGITVQNVSYNKWEIFLYEKNNRYALSKMGSGLKTIILVLLNLLVVPCTDKYETISRENVDYGKIIFAFEELENNLHPALQRRLFDYIYKFSIEHDTTVLLTTHSHVAINMFADKEETQLYHVIKEYGKSSIEKVGDYITKSEILNDLDVRASDLLQSNGIIWVEGPSDKVYIKRWLEIWGDKDLVEGVDYQFLYYGGRTLSHFTANPYTEDDDLINILTTNRNAAIVIDSDICGKKKGINVTKTRIKKEFKSNERCCWITKGKEIENYIPYQAINKAYGNDKLKAQCGQNDKFPEYIKQQIGNKTFNKVGFAHKVIEHISDENSKDILDLKSNVEKLSEKIRSWNSKCEHDPIES